MLSKSVLEIRATALDPSLDRLYEDSGHMRCRMGAELLKEEYLSTGMLEKEYVIQKALGSLPVGDAFFVVDKDGKEYLYPIDRSKDND